jgi:hypothetical protein
VGVIAFAAMLLVGSTVAFAATDAVDYRLIHQFNGSDGNEPNFMIRASDGNLYGTAFVGGVGGQGVGNGTIFRETPGGTSPCCTRSPTSRTVRSPPACSRPATA